MNHLKQATLLGVLAVAVTTLLASGPARAEEGPSPTSEVPHADTLPPASPPATPGAPPEPAPSAFTLHIKGLLGLATPYGFGGAELELSGRIFSLATGVGAGAFGTQLAIMARARTPGLLFVDGGLGVSGGNFRDYHICLNNPCEQDPVQTATWTNLEAGGGLQFEYFHLRLFLGLTNLNNPGTFEQEFLILPYGGLSLGFSLPL
jgi:hypothetical protein